jgi:hypothetical protein
VLRQWHWPATIVVSDDCARLLCMSCTDAAAAVCFVNIASKSIQVGAKLSRARAHTAAALADGCRTAALRHFICPALPLLEGGGVISPRYIVCVMRYAISYATGQTVYVLSARLCWPCAHCAYCAWLFESLLSTVSYSQVVTAGRREAN